MSSPWTDLSRPPLSAARLRHSLAGDTVWREIRVVDVTESTSTDLASAARSGTPEGLVVVAEQQLAGRGRLDRRWSAPARSSLLLSVLLRPAPEPGSWPLLPLLCGLAVVEALAAVAEVDASLKWPNDVIVDDRKLAGLLAERVEDAVVVGIGLNVSLRAEELPVPTATSLRLLGGVTDRESLLKELLRSLARRYTAWSDTRGAAATVLPAYRSRCGTIGRQVSVSLPGGDVVRGTAEAVDDTGRLVVRDDRDGTRHAFLAGEVTHVRPGG